jgi:hypothetical protein
MPRHGYSGRQSEWPFQRVGGSERKSLVAYNDDVVAEERVLRVPHERVSVPKRAKKSIERGNRRERTLSDVLVFAAENVRVSRMTVRNDLNQNASIATRVPDKPLFFSLTFQHLHRRLSAG